jgi:hypothetical protein
MRRCGARTDGHVQRPAALSDGGALARQRTGAQPLVLARRAGDCRSTLADAQVAPYFVDADAASAKAAGRWRACSRSAA